MRRPLIATAVFAALTVITMPSASAAAPALIAQNSQHAVLSVGGSVAAYLYTDSSGEQFIRRSTVGDASHPTMNYPVSSGRRAQFDLSGNGERVAITKSDPDGGNPWLQVRNVWNSTHWSVPGSFTKISRPSTSLDGRFTSFAGTASDTGKTNAYRFDMMTRTVTQLTHGDGVTNVVISGDGHATAYAAGGHTWVRRGTSGDRKQADVNSRGQSYGGTSRPYALSDNGHFVLFTSTSTRSGRSQCATAGGCLYRADLSEYDVRPASFDLNYLYPISGDLDSYAADLSGDGRVAVWAEGDQPSAHVYRFSTGHQNAVSTNSDADKGVTDVSIDRDGGYSSYTTTVSSVGSDLSTWRASSGV